MAKGARVAGGSIDFDLVIVGVDDSQKKVVDSLKKIESVAKQTRDKIASAWGSGIEKLRAGFDLLKGAVGSIQNTVAAFVDRMSGAVSASRDFGVGIDQARQAMKFAEISGVSLEEAMSRVGESSAEAKAAQKANAKAMLEWKMLTSDLYDIMVDIGGELLKSIAPAFPTIVAATRVLGDVLTKYVFPVFLKITNLLLNIREVMSVIGDAIVSAFELAGTAIINEFKNWFGYFEKIGVGAVTAVLNVFTQSWATMAAALEGTQAGEKMLSAELKKERDRLTNEEYLRRARSGRYISDTEYEQIKRSMTRHVIELEAAGGVARRKSYVEQLGVQIDQERAGRDAQTAAKLEETGEKFSELWTKLGDLATFAPDDTDWSARLAGYMEAALAPKAEAIPEMVAEKAVKAPERAEIMGSFSSFGVAQRGGTSPSEVQQQQVDLLRALLGGIQQLIKVAGGSLVAVSSGNPTRTELRAQ